MGVDLSQVVKSTETVIKQNAPAIFTGIGVVSMVSSAVLVGFATPKALKAIEEKKDEEEVDKLEPVEVVKTVWKFYIPPVAAGIAGITFLILAHNEHTRRGAALAAAYAMSESKLLEYSEKVKETIGEKKEREVRDEIAKDRLKLDPVEKKEVIITGHGDVRCYDHHAGRYFTSDIDKLRKIQNEINDKLIKEGYISLNEFYYAIGLDGTEIGRQLGWRVEQGLLELDFSSQLDSEGVPCLTIDYNIVPKYDYDKWY